MDQEVPLPPLRLIRHRSPTRVPEHAFRKPKRLSSRLSQSSLPSSDPALFSSDDIPSLSLENYHGTQHEQSRKRRYRGTWWGEMAKEAKRKRADFREKRNLDSGVWMGSDEPSSDCLLSSEASLAEDFSTHIETSQCRGKDDQANGRFGARNTERNDKSRPVFAAGEVRIDEPLEHRNARAVINQCLEKGMESIDLSNLELKCIPKDLLRPLMHMTKQPAVAAGPVADEVFTPLIPSLRLFLSGDSLTEMTSEVFDLGNLNVLSVRHNQLREIPSAIRKLTRLQTVNLSMNQLSTLPWELLWLIRKGDLRQMIVHPNPLRVLENETANVAQWHYGDGSLDKLRSCTYEGPIPEDAWAPIHIATSRVQLYDAEGRLVQSPGKSLNTLRDATSKVPSLRELALLECTKAPYLDQNFIDAAESADWPAPVVRLLRTALSVRDTGGMSCSVCHRTFVVTRVQWVEWWDCDTYENGLMCPRASGAELRPLPFLRRACSWSCVPDSDQAPVTDAANAFPNS